MQVSKKITTEIVIEYNKVFIIIIIFMKGKFLMKFGNFVLQTSYTSKNNMCSCGFSVLATL